MNKYHYEGKTKEAAIELALADLKIAEEDIIINDVEEKNVIIGTESSSGAEYECRNIADLRKAITSYAYNYLNYENDETYSIKIWKQKN